MGRTSAGLCTLQTACPLTVTYSGGAPAPDTIAAGSAATVYGGSAAAFDAAADVWVVLTVPGSSALQVVKEADLATVTGDWTGLARIVQHTAEPYQPQAYLASGGLGGAATTLLPPVVSGVGLGKTFVLGSEPSGWQDPGYDDSAWSASLAGPIGDVSIAGAAWESYLAGNTNAPASQVFLYRRTFALPAGLVTAALLTLAADDYAAAVWINGTLVYGSVTTVLWHVSTDVTVLPSLLLGGAANVIAIKVQNSAGGVSPTGTAYSLALSESATGGAPTSGPGGTVPPSALPVATTGSTGIVQVGSGLAVTGGGVLSATTSGTVTSVAVAVPAPLSSSGGPVTSSGTITLAWASGQTANRVLASPDGSSGAVALRALVAADIPSLPASQIASGQLAAARGGTGQDGSSAANGALLIGNGSGYALATLTAGSGVTVTNGPGTVTIAASGGSGTVTSVALTVPGFLSVSGSPLTTSGTLAVTLATQSANTVLAGPSSGSAAAPTFRALAAADLPPAAAAGGHVHAYGHFI